MSQPTGKDKDESGCFDRNVSGVDLWRRRRQYCFLINDFNSFSLQSQAFWREVLLRWHCSRTRIGFWLAPPWTAFIQRYINPYSFTLEIRRHRHIQDGRRDSRSLWWADQPYQDREKTIQDKAMPQHLDGAALGREIPSRDLSPGTRWIFKWPGRSKQSLVFQLKCHLKWRVIILQTKAREYFRSNRRHATTHLLQEFMI